MELPQSLQKKHQKLLQALKTTVRIWLTCLKRLGVHLYVNGWVIAGMY
ncbi:hypothetical protein AAKU64_003732 [Undibacterium sp. GrIS 1.8]